MRYARWALLVLLVGLSPHESFGSAGTLTVSPTSWAAGTVDTGTTSTRVITITNTGTVSVTVNSITVGSGEFSISATSPTPAYSLAAKKTATFTIKFAPTLGGTVSSTVSVNSTATGSPIKISVNGTGQHTVSLSWDESSSVIGYNVYRSTINGGPYGRINTNGLVTNTAYVDNTVSPNTTYYYVVTAVNSDDQESTYSNQTQAAVGS